MAEAVAGGGWGAISLSHESCTLIAVAVAAAVAVCVWGGAISFSYIMVI